MIRFLSSSSFSWAVLLAAMLLVPSSGWANTSKNCPSEPAQNVSIVSGETYWGTNCVLNTASDVDSFTFNASAGDTWSIVLGLGPSPATNICLTLTGPGNPPPVIFPTTCTFTHNLIYALATNQKLTASGTYTIVVTEATTAAVSYGLSLERLSPPPGDAQALVLGQTVTSGIVVPTAQNLYTFYGATTGTYQILASLAPGSANNVCFAVYLAGTSALTGNPFCTFLHNGVVSYETDLTPSQNGTYLLVVYTGPNGSELVGPNDGTVNYSLSVTCISGPGTCPMKMPPPPVCSIKDVATYNATSGIITMNFTVGTPIDVTWNGWLTYGDTMESLWSQSLPITLPPITVAKTQAVAKSGKVGVLSTLVAPPTSTTPGITCSSWSLINTGKP